VGVGLAVRRSEHNSCTLYAFHVHAPSSIFMHPDLYLCTLICMFAGAQTTNDGGVPNSSSPISMHLRGLARAMVSLGGQAAIW
jgi:hypothetical protein